MAESRKVGLLSDKMSSMYRRVCSKRARRVGWWWMRSEMNFNSKVKRNRFAT